MSLEIHKTVAVIPVRGGSVGIPRKNARILGGKPLLAHSIETVLRCAEIDKVYVSTDDAELAEIAERFGAMVLPRPDSLAQGMTTLDEVMAHGVEQLEQVGESFDFIVTIQATSPLLKPGTIDRAVRKCREEGLDTVLSVVDSPHLAWTKRPDGQLAPLYEKRLNRQQLPPYYRETGGVVVAARGVLQGGSRFGSRIGVVEVDKAESLDIDDYFDWWLVEKSLARRRICFHVIGNRQTGLGHAYRVLTLADRLIDHDLFFIMNDEADLARELIRKRSYPVTSVPAGEELNAIVKAEADLVINDVLDTDAGFVAALKAAGITTVNFEDLGSGSLEADYLINAMYDYHPSGRAERAYHGVGVDCLRDEFYSVEPIRVRKEVENVLVLFGGTDPNDLTLKCLRWIDELEGPWKITVVLGLGYPHPEEVEAFAKNAEHRVDVVVNTPVISRYMAQADVAVTSAGRTVFELASLGVPQVVIAQNERELHHVFACDSPGVVFLGAAWEVGRSGFCESLKQVLFSELLRRQMHQCLLEADIRGGVRRVLGVIEAALETGQKAPEAF